TRPARTGRLRPTGGRAVDEGRMEPAIWSEHPQPVDGSTRVLDPAQPAWPDWVNHCASAVGALAYLVRYSTVQHARLVRRSVDGQLGVSNKSGGRLSGCHRLVRTG